MLDCHPNFERFNRLNFFNEKSINDNDSNGGAMTFSTTALRIMTTSVDSPPDTQHNDNDGTKTSVNPYIQNRGTQHNDNDSNGGAMTFSTTALRIMTTSVDSPPDTQHNNCGANISLMVPILSGQGHSELRQ